MIVKERLCSSFHILHSLCADQDTKKRWVNRNLSGLLTFFFFYLRGNVNAVTLPDEKSILNSQCLRMQMKYSVFLVPRGVMWENRKEVSRISFTDFLYHVKSQTGCSGQNQRKAKEKTPRENEFSNFFSSKHRKLELTKKSIFEINLAFFLSRNSGFNIRIYIFLILGKCWWSIHDIKFAWMKLLAFSYLAFSRS